MWYGARGKYDNKEPESSQLQVFFGKVFYQLCFQADGLQSYSTAQSLGLWLGSNLIENMSETKCLIKTNLNSILWSQKDMGELNMVVTGGHKKVGNRLWDENQSNVISFQLLDCHFTAVGYFMDTEFFFMVISFFYRFL